MLVRTDAQTIAEFETDESGIFHASGIEAVFYPANAADVRQILQEANAQKKLVTISGGGTGLTGGRVATEGGWILSTTELREASLFTGSRAQPLNITGEKTELEAPPKERAFAADTPYKICEGEQFGRHFRLLLDEEHQEVIVPAGITLELLGQMLPPGLIYPPDPTERTATIGGTIATNASGARTFYFGPTRQWILGLEIVLPEGEIAIIERGDVQAQEGVLRFAVGKQAYEIKVPTYQMPPVKNAAGLYAQPNMDLIDLFIGAEGILGVVTQARIKLAPVESDIIGEIAFFSRLDEALGFVEDLRQAKHAGAPVLSIEFFDEHALRFMQHPSVRGDYAAAIYTEILGGIEEAEPLLAALEKHNAAQDWFAETPTERQEQQAFRHSLPEGVNTYLRRHGSYKLGTDFAVPAAQFGRLLELTQAAAEEFRTRFPREGEHTATWGHIGNYHLHFNFLACNEEELAVARRLYVQLAQEAVALGGTISAEHGVGKKTVEIEGQILPYLQLMYGREGLQEIAAVKRALDPLWILNRGNMTPGP